MGLVPPLSVSAVAAVMVIAGYGHGAAAAPKSPAGPRFTVTEAAPPGSGVTLSQAVALNDRGQAVVQWIGGKTSGCYVWEWGKAPLPLGTLPNGYRLEPVGINNSGQVVGTAWDDSDLKRRRRRAFLWERGTARDLGTPDGEYSQAYAINNRGEVLVTTQLFGDPAKPNHITKTGASLWSEAKGFVPLPARFAGIGNPTVLNDRGQIVGNGWITPEEHRDTLAKADRRILPDTDGAPPWRAFLYENGTFRRLPVERSWSTKAEAINSRGDVLLNVEMLYRWPHTLPGGLFLWRNGHAKLLMAPISGSVHSISGSGVEGVSLNDAGDVAATLAPPRAAGTQPWMFPTHDEKNRAVLYRGGVLYHLDDCIPKGSGWRLTSARQINNRGQIIGTGMYRGRLRAFLLTPVK